MIELYALPLIVLAITVIAVWDAWGLEIKR